jgi:hypothetical protein
VNRNSAFALLLAIVLTGALPSGAETTAPAVARPTFELGGLTSSGGTVFFVRVDSAVGYAAIGTAHGFDLELLSQAEEVNFDLGHSGRRVATSRGFLVPPGRPFFGPGSTLRDDFNVYALTARPEGVRVLELHAGSDLAVSTRVRVLGIPQSASHDESDVFGRISELSRDHIEIDLDVPFDLRGWGGAPALDAKTGKVLGILEASSPRDSVARVSVAPITGVREALAKLLDGGAGRPFARFAEEIRRRPAAPAPARTSPRRSARKRSRPPPRSGPLLAHGPRDGTNVRLEVEFPQDGAAISDSICGAFVSGRAIAHYGELKRFDVVLVIDTSESTSNPTGADINGNGIVGAPRLGKAGSAFFGDEDDGDSILAAEVAAARQLLRGLDPRSTRVAVIRFAGDRPGSGGGIFGRPPRRPAVTVEPLTNDYSRVEIALRNILLDTPAGMTHIAAGVDQATIELAGWRGGLSTPDPDSEKVVFFFTDGQPTLPHDIGFEADNVRAVLRAASRANRKGIRIHSFAIGPDALSGPIATVEMASLTGGYFTPVRHPGDLIDAVEEVSFANLSEVRLHNKTTGEDADPFRTTADGTWGGFVKLDRGANEIEITARADDGTAARETIAVHFRAEAPDPVIPPDLMVQRNRLLEDCLINLKRVRAEAEEERNQQVRRELKMEIERERLKARERAEEQRKQLQIGIEEEEE